MNPKIETVKISAFNSSINVIQMTCEQSAADCFQNRFHSPKKKKKRRGQKINPSSSLLQNQCRNNNTTLGLQHYLFDPQTFSKGRQTLKILLRSQTERQEQLLLLDAGSLKTNEAQLRLHQQDRQRI